MKFIVLIVNAIFSFSIFAGPKMNYFRNEICHDFINSIGDFTSDKTGLVLDSDFKFKLGNDERAPLEITLNDGASETMSGYIPNKMKLKRNKSLFEFRKRVGDKKLKSPIDFELRFQKTEREEKPNEGVKLKDFVKKINGLSFKDKKNVTSYTIEFEYLAYTNPKTSEVYHFCIPGRVVYKPKGTNKDNEILNARLCRKLNDQNDSGNEPLTCIENNFLSQEGSVETKVQKIFKAVESERTNVGRLISKALDKKNGFLNVFDEVGKSFNACRNFNLYPEDQSSMGNHIYKNMIESKYIPGLVYNNVPKPEDVQVVEPAQKKVEEKTPNTETIKLD